MSGHILHDIEKHAVLADFVLKYDPDLTLKTLVCTSHRVQFFSALAHVRKLKY